MPLPRQLLQIDYDQYQRYAAITVLLKPLLRARQAQSRHPLRILEVGSHSLNLLPAFLAPLPVEIVRADLEPGLAGDLGPYVTIEAGAPLPFADDAFDYLVAMEVLEHIPSAERCSAVKEWARVSTLGVFFTCPNGNRVRRVEARADAAFQARHGRVHPWLEEHERFGRPTRLQVEELCAQAGLNPHRFQNSPLAEWLPLLLVTEQLFEKGDKELFRRFNEMLNSRHFQAFIRKPSYRSIYAAFPDEVLKTSAFELWQSAGITDCKGNPGTPPTAEQKIDPVRLLAKQLSDQILNHRANEVQMQELQRLQRERIELQARVEQTELALTLERYLHQPRNSTLPSSPSLEKARLHHLKAISPQQWLVQPDPAQPGLPSFEWDVTLQKGWHQVVVEGQMAEAYALKLYLDYGFDFNETHLLQMTGWPEGHHRCSFNVYLDHPVRRLRLCCTQQKGILKLETFRVMPRAAWQVAWDGLLLAARELLNSPKQTWKRTIAAKTSLLRYGMELTTRPRNLPFDALTPYQLWLRQQRPSPQERHALQVLHQNSPVKLVFFLRCPKSLPLHAIAKTVQSLHQQDACNWEVWIAASHAQQQQLENLAVVRQLGERLHWLDDGDDIGMARHFNHAVKASFADWIVQLEAGDQLEPDSALCLLETSRIHPHSVLLYADEDFLVPGVGESDPLLKPRFMPETVRFQPELIGRAIALHGPTLKRLGGLNPTYDGALIPEYLQRLFLSQHQFTQVNRVLLHRTPAPPAGEAVKLVWERLRQDYAPENYQIETFRTTVNERDSIRPASPLAYASATSGLISIVIPSAGKITRVKGETHLHLERCLHALRKKTTYDKLEIIVVEDGTLAPQAGAAVERYHARRVTVPGPFNFARSINRAAAKAQGDYLLLLNDDTEVITSDWLQRMLSLCHDQMGAVGARLLFPTGLVQHLGISLRNGIPIHPWYNQPPLLHSELTTTPRNWLAVTAACLLTPRRAFDAVHGFDESFELNYNDVDFCLRLWQAGYRVVMNPTVELYHHEALRTDGRALYRPDELARFQARWRDTYAVDPYLRMPPGEWGIS